MCETQKIKTRGNFSFAIESDSKIGRIECLSVALSSKNYQHGLGFPVLHAILQLGH